MWYNVCVNVKAHNKTQQTKLMGKIGQEMYWKCSDGDRTH